MTVRAYLCILLPLACGMFCHWRYRQLSRSPVGPISIYRRQQALYRTAWFAYGMAACSAVLFATWAVT